MSRYFAQSLSTRIADWKRGSDLMSFSRNSLLYTPCPEDVFMSSWYPVFVWTHFMIGTLACQIAIAPENSLELEIDLKTFENCFLDFLLVGGSM